MNCNCNAYPFPHRPMSGRCDGTALWQTVFESGEACAGCVHRLVLTEAHPYGEIRAVESLRDCLARTCRECPGVTEGDGRVAA